MEKIFKLEDNVLIWPNNEEIVFFLPILPPNICFNDHAYQRFVNSFHNMTIQYVNEELANIKVKHVSGVEYHFEGLSAFIENLEVNHNDVVLVPYCPQEGVPNIDVFGAKLNVEFINE